VHYHIEDFVRAIQERLGRKVLELEMLQGNACFAGTPQAIADAIASTVRGSCGTPRSWNTPRPHTLMHVKGITDAIMSAAELVDENTESDEHRDIAVAYVLTETAAGLLELGRRVTPYSHFYVHCMRSRLLKAAAEASDRDALEAVQARMPAFEDEVADLYDEGKYPVPEAFRWFPNTMEQAKLVVTDKDTTDRPLPKELKMRVSQKLSERYSLDGTTFRTDSEVDEVVAEVRTEMDAEENLRCVLKTHYRSLARAMGLPESVPIRVTIKGNPKSFKDAKVCDITMVIDDEGVYSRMATAETPSNPLEALLNALRSMTMGVIGIRIE
jgi:hypothetical protein